MSLGRRMREGIERDLREHIEMETRENLDRGMPPEEARAAALRKFGNLARVAEETRAVWQWTWAERLAQDVRYAVRGLRSNPVFTAVAVMTLALGIGMNTAVFSVVSAALIKPLPYPDSERIVWLANSDRRLHRELASAPDFADWREQAHSFEAMAGYMTRDSTVQDGDQSAKHSFVSTTPEFWHIAGAHAAAGRLFSEGERNVVVLTWRMFQQRFGGDARAVGRAVRVDGQPATIIGVLPEGFRFLPPAGAISGMSGEAEAFTPNVIGPELRSRGNGILILFVVAKLKLGISVVQAHAEMQVIQDRIARQNPGWNGFYRSSELRVVSLQEKLVGESRRTLLVLLAAVGFVLLIACANLGNLLLARATARQREIAIRAAIGAGRGRLVRQFLAEGLTLALAGGAAGVALARGADALLVRLSPSAVPRLGEVGIDWRVLGFVLGISVVAGAVFGLAPALSLSTGSLYGVLKEGGRGSTAPASLHVRRLLVAAELALALVLLTGAGLMVKSFARMYAHPASFEPEKIGIMQVWLSGPAYRERSAYQGYVQRMLERLGGMPGVEAAAVTSSFGSQEIHVEGMTFPPGQAAQMHMRNGSAGYPRVVGLRLIRGRWTTDDEPARAVMVNQALVRRVFGSSDPLGHQIRDMGKLYTIVGVVDDLKVSRLDAEPEPEVLMPYKQAEIFRRMDVLVKTAGTPAAILPEVRQAVHWLDPSQPPYGITTLEGALAESIAPRRFNLLLLGTFAASAVLLALIGIYGVMSYAVTQRTHEIGVRVALGARRGAIVRMVVRQGMTVALVGIAVGVAAALGLTRLMATMLFEVKPDDPLTFVAVAATLTAAALAACWLPAVRAARVDPLVALRYE
jgi:putative ABC transport system permease protein